MMLLFRIAISSVSGALIFFVVASLAVDFAKAFILPTSSRCYSPTHSSHHHHHTPSLEDDNRHASTTSVLLQNDTNNNNLQQNLYNTTIIANYTFRTPTPDQLQTISERQVFHNLDPSQVFCTSSNLCKHGHPQAFGFHPTKGPKLVSGLFRLSCPLLCEAIDEYENNEGGVRQMSDWLRSKDIMIGDKDYDYDKRNSIDWKREGYEQANLAQKQIRTELAKDDQIKLIARMGEFNARAFMRSGVAGIPASQTYNVKCCHAHVADHLCRCSSSSSSSSVLNNDSSNENNDMENNNAEEDAATKGGNIIGQHTLDILEKKGVPINGNDVCWQQCNVNHERGSGDWRYLAKKNRSGLRRRGSNSRTRKFSLSD